MPSFAFLSRRELDTSLTQRKLAALARLGHPYTPEQIANAAADARAEAARIADALRRDGVALDEAAARSETLALIAYLQSLGHAVRGHTPQGGA